MSKENRFKVVYEETGLINEKTVSVHNMMSKL